MKSGIKRAKYIIFESDSDQEEEEDNDIIVLSDTDGSESGDDKSKAESTPGKKDSSMRRNIRKIMSNDKLALETRQAQKEEQERQKRLKERVQVDVEDRVIFEGTKSNPVVEVRQELVKKLKPHQREGVKFLWNNTCEDLKTMQETPGSGAILAHCMGLGKTIQLIAFVDTLLCHKETGVKTVLIIVPKNTLSNWMAEFNLWAGDSEYHVFNFNDYSSKAMQFELISSWHRRGGVGIISFTTYRNLTSNKGKASRKKKEKLLEYLRNPGPDIVVCDEGHLLKNYKSALSLTVNQIQTRRRIALTGTPLQNNLQEYYTMVSFVKPSLLGTLKEFNNRFGNPIKNGQCKDATAADVRTMKRRAHVLNYLLRNCVQRMDYRVLTTCLPGKHEYVVKVRLSEVQEKLYTTILYDNRSRGVMAIFKLFQSMMRIWNHPWMLKLYQQRKESELSDSEEDSDLGGFICNDSEAEEELMAIEAKHKKKKMKGKSKSSRPGSRSSLASTTSSASSLPSLSPMTYITLDDEDSPRLSPIVPKMPEDTSDQSPAAPTEWYHGILTDDMEYSLKVSAKLLFLKELLQETARLGEKVLLFSQSLLTLDTIEKFLQLSDFGSLTPELDYFRLDGSTGSHDRETMMKRFNKVGNKRIRLFLISTRAGSLGINLVSANRVVIFDACWNPSHDLQAIFRVYRYGQMKPVFIYRLIAKGTMEEKIYDRQVTKESTALRVIDDKQIDRHFSNADLQDILKYTPADLSEVNEKERPEADPVFCNILDHLQPGYLLSYHTHDSLLVHQQDEELTEDEKGKAWEEYQHILEGKAYYMAQTWQANVTETVQNGSFPATMIEGPQQLYPQGSGFRPIAAAQPQPQQQHYTILPNITAESQQNKYLDEWMRIVQHLHNYMGDVHEIYMQLQDAQRNHDAHRVNLLLQEIDRKMVMKHSNLTTIRESINQLASNPGLRGHPLLPTLNSAYAKAFQTWGEYRRTLQR
jgi:transcriptional regulator ATRX